MFPKESLRNCGEQAGAVSASSIGVDATAMFEADQGFQRTFDHLVRSFATQASDKADTAGVMINEMMFVGHF
jgi:hypothetical protein